MGKRGKRSSKGSKKDKRSYLKRRADHKENRQEHKRRADRISYIVLLAAAFTMANVVMAVYGVLPYPYGYFMFAQLFICIVMGYLTYVVMRWNHKMPVYRETFWMLALYVPLSLVMTGWSSSAVW